MIGPASADGETQRHCLQRSRLVSGNLQALDLRSKVDGILTNSLGGPATSFRQQIAQAFAMADQFDSVEESVAVAESQPGLAEQSALGAFHRKRDRPAGANRVEAQIVAQLRRQQDNVRIANAAQRTQSKQIFVFQTDS